jgi:hypothetical protein
MKTTYQQPVVLRELALLRALGSGLRSSKYQRLVGNAPRFAVPPTQSAQSHRRPSAIREPLMARPASERP